MLLSSLAIVLVAAAIAAWIGGRLVPGLLAVSLTLILLMAWRMARELQPRSLQLFEQTLVIATQRQRIEVPIVDATARTLGDDEIRHLERLASAGGFVAAVGGFDSHQLGEFDLYASDLRHSVLIEAFDSRLVVTPDRPPEFVAAFRRAAASAPATIPSP